MFEPRAMKFNVKEPKRQEVSEIEGVDDLSGEWILDVSVRSFKGPLKAAI